MTILDEISCTYKRLKRARERLEYLDLMAGAPRSSVYSDMPKGCMNVSNPTEDSYIRKEELAEKCRKIEERLVNQWERAVSEMNAAHIGDQVQKMLYLRFFCGMQWEKCAKCLDKEFPNHKWNTSKCFRKYRDAVIKLRRK